MTERQADMSPECGWLGGLRRYLAVSLLGNALWEPAQLPLYTIWHSGTTNEKLFAVLHCTAGDMLIALGSWALAVVVAGRPNWPARSFGPVALLTIAAGLVYTGFSEWLNTTVRQSWTYSDSMPVIPKLGLGVSPLLQWLIVPALALAAARGAKGGEERRQ